MKVKDQSEVNLKKVRKVLLKLKKDGKIEGFQPVTYLNGEVKDFLVFNQKNPYGNPMPLKIKDSENGQKIHERLYPKVPSLRIGTLGMPAVIEEKLIKVIEGFEKEESLHV